MIHIGVDPGLTGCVAVLDANTRRIRFFDTPVVEIKVGKSMKHEINIPEAVEILRGVGKDCLVCIEKVQAMPGGGERTMGATSAFNFGKGFGIWLGIITALGLPYQQVHPATWKSRLMAGMSKEKDASRVRAMELYPEIAKELSRKKDHGRADALLLARYGYLMVPTPPEKPELSMQSLFDQQELTVF